MKLALITTAALLACWAASPARADIEIRVSVKWILNSDGTRPMFDPGDGGWDISTAAGFQQEIDHGNTVLQTSGRRYRLVITHSADIQPAAPAGQPADYWYNLPARENAATIEAVAKDNTNPWQWTANAINIYINNTRSGQCSFPANGNTISLGANIFSRGTVIHEIGHFFNQRHTHLGDCPNDFVPPTTQAGLASHLRDGDNLSETATDVSCYGRDQLSIAHFGGAYPGLSDFQKRFIDTAWNNVMSYHNEVEFLPVQLDEITEFANSGRAETVSGHTWFLDPSTDDNLHGLSRGQRFKSLGRAQNLAYKTHNVLLMKTGTYHESVLLTKPFIFVPEGGPVIITSQP